MTRHPSPRNGRLVAESTALAEYRTSRDSVPVATSSSLRESSGEGSILHGRAAIPTVSYAPGSSDAGGLWDYEQEAALGPRRGPPRPQRYDAVEMAAYTMRFTLADHELDVYTYFWVNRLSYKQIADRIGSTREQVYQVIKRLRVKAHGVQ